MKRYIISCLLIASVLCMLILPPHHAAEAYLKKDWSYASLFERSDAVVIGMPRESKRGDLDIDLRKHGITGKLISTVTTIRIRSTLKGKVSGSSISVVHYTSIETNAAFLDDPPETFSFPSPPVRKNAMGVAATNPDEDYEYIMYLSYNDKSGRFTPVSGYYDPKASIRRLVLVP